MCWALLVCKSSQIWVNNFYQEDEVVWYDLPRERTQCRNVLLNQARSSYQAMISCERFIFVWSANTPAQPGYDWGIKSERPNHPQNTPKYNTNTPHYYPRRVFFSYRPNKETVYDLNFWYSYFFLWVWTSRHRKRFSNTSTNK